MHLLYEKKNVKDPRLEQGIWSEGVSSWKGSVELASALCCSYYESGIVLYTHNISSAFKCT